MKCNKCNKEIPDISKFCLHCGAKVILVCSKCGSTNIPLNSNFCPDCGNPMTKENIRKKCFIGRNNDYRKGKAFNFILTQVSTS